MTTILTRTIARLLLLPTFVVAMAMLVKGYADVGDGFSAGVIAATGILLQTIATNYREVERLLPVRFAPAMASVGLFLALLVAFGPTLQGEALFTHIPRAGDEAIHVGTFLELHTAVLFDLGVFCLVFSFVVSTVRLLARLSERGEA